MKRQYVGKEGEQGEKWREQRVARKQCGVSMKRSRKIWGITKAHSPSVGGVQKPVKADNIFTH